MKYLTCFLLSILTGLYSCDNRKDYFDNIGNRLSLSKTGTSELLTHLSDSVKGTFAYTCNYTINSPEKLKLNYKFKKGNGIVSSTSNTIIVSPTDMGSNIIDFWVTDKNGAVSNAELELMHFTNLKPVAVLNLIKTNSTDNIEITFIASGSYDRDAKYGGKIVLYNYYIAEVPYYASLTADTMFYAMGKASKSYMVRLSVKDNDNDTAYVVKTLIIP